nr:putative integron gene cassette protein [uncultured bacterium]
MAHSCRLSDALHSDVYDPSRANIAMPSWPDFSTRRAGDSSGNIVPDFMKKLTPESSFYSFTVLLDAVA